MLSVLLVWARYAALIAARAVGWLRHALYDGWRRPLVGLAAVGLAIWVLARPLDVLRSSTFRWSVVLGAFAGLALATWIVKARSRLVVGDFVDFRSGEAKVMPGLSNMLVVELGRLYDLFRVVDRSRAAPNVLKGPQNVYFDEDRRLFDADRDETFCIAQPLEVPAPIKAEELTEVLDSVVSVEATVGVASVKLPIGALAALLGRIARGPRVTGAVHRVGDRLVVTARTVGDSRSRTWRVDGAPSGQGAGDGPPQPEELLDELAVRMFTDLALRESVKWRATWAYVNGLRDYRDCLRTKKDRRRKLEQAKQRFIETIVEDDRFELAYYNLGVVATELGQHEAAEAAFLQALDKNNLRWEPYYGLAQLYFVQKRYLEMLPLCRRMVRLRRHRAETYHLLALATRHLLGEFDAVAEGGAGEAVAQRDGHPGQARRGDVRAAVKERRKAVRWAWVRLCRAALAGREREARGLAAISLRNLAGLRAYQAKEWRCPDRRRRFPAAVGAIHERRRALRRAVGYWAARWELAQGRFLDASDAELHFELGKIYAACCKWRRAARAFERAVDLSPDRPRLWIQLARACSHLPGRRDDAICAARRALEQPSQIVGGGFKRLLEVQKKLGEKGEAERVAALAKFVRRREAWKRPDEPSIEEIERLLESYLKREDLWPVAQLFALGQRSVAVPPWKLAAEVVSLFDKKRQILEKEYQREVQRHELYAAAAEALHAAGRCDEALPWAEAAVARDPLSARARRSLAEAHLALGHFEQAEAAGRAALLCDPDDPGLSLSVGECLVRSALACHDPDRRRPKLRDATGHLQSAADLYELEAGTGRSHPGSANGDGKGRARFWLGRAFFELDDYERAATNLRLCCLVECEPLLSRLRLGVALVRLGALADGEQELRRVEHDANARAGAGEPTQPAGPPGDRMSLQEVVAWARLQLTMSQVERGVHPENASRTIREVRATAQALEDVDAKNSLLAAAADCEGWAAFRRGADRSGVLRSLVSSIQLVPTPEAYMHLALVHAEMAMGQNGAVRDQEAEVFAGLAALARRMGLGKRQGQPIDLAEQRLKATANAPAESSPNGRIDLESPARPGGG